jgi:hypothetical protein
MGDELDDIVDNEANVILGGKTRTLHFGLLAWKKLKKEHGGFDKITEELKSNPVDFITEKLPSLIQIALIKNEGSDITVEQVEEWLDEYTITGLKEKIMPAFQAALIGSAPRSDKKAGTDDPQAAEKI